MSDKLFLGHQTRVSYRKATKIAQATINKMSLSKPATEVTEEYTAAMEEAIEFATKAEAEANRLKRKYEPDKSEVRLDKILHLQATYDHAFMRVQIFTGEKMELTLIPNTRNWHATDWTFHPHLTDRRDNKECIEEFGIYRVYVGDGGEGYELLVTFDPKGVRIRQLDESIPDGGDDPEPDLKIEILDEQPEFTLTHE